MENVNALPVSKPKPPRFRRWIVATGLAGLALLSCDNSSSPEIQYEPTPERTLDTIRVNAVGAYWLPDSVSWKFGSLSGSSRIFQSQVGKDTFLISIEVPHQAPGATDTLVVRRWSHQVQQAQYTFVFGQTGLEIQSNSTSATSAYLLYVLDSLARGDSAKQVKNSSYPRSRVGVENAYGRLLVEGSTKIQLSPATIPAGLVIDSIVTHALVYAAQTGVPLRELAKTWSPGIGLDFATAKARLLSLQQSGQISSANWATLFPASSVVWLPTSSFGVDSASITRGSTQRIHGTVVSPTGFKTIRFSLLKDGAVPSGFSPTAIDFLKDTVKFDGAASFVVPGAAGTYSLSVLAIATNDDSLKASVSFQVADPVNGAALPPAVFRKYPVQGDTSLSYLDSAITIRWSVSDPHGLSSVQIDKVLLDTNSQGEYVKKVVLQPGEDRWIVLLAKSKLDSISVDSIHIRRSQDNVKPQMIHGIFLPDSLFVKGVYQIKDGTPITLQWKVSDNAKLADTALVYYYPGDYAHRVAIPVANGTGTLTNYEVPQSPATRLIIRLSDAAGNFTEEELVFSRPYAQGKQGAIWDDPSFLWDSPNVLWQ